MSLEPDLLRQRLLGSPILGPHIISIIWIGSRSRAHDIHELSDLDVQIILDHPDIDTTIELAGVLADYSDMDLSILYSGDIVDDAGRLNFQDGTKGAFFIQVLADGIVLHGEDIYSPMASELDLTTVKPSLMFTIREYLGRLRVMAVRGQEPTYMFKKYCVKLLKDVLVYDGQLALIDMTRTPNADTLNLVKMTYPLDPVERPLISRLVDFSDPFGSDERAVVLSTCERLVEKLRRGQP